MGAQEKRATLKRELWPEDRAWTGEEVGWFKAPRTLPLLLVLMKEKDLRGKESPASAYVELLSHHYGGGIIELKSEAEHAYAAGFTGARATRSWRERIQTLESLGFIKTKGAGNTSYKYVLLRPAGAVAHSLKEAGKLNENWWRTYRDRQLDTKEMPYSPTAEEVEAAAEVIKIPKTSKKSKAKRK